METFSSRIKKAMNSRNIKQSELVEKTGINKGALSSYLSGRYEPKQTNIYLLAKALDVNEAWLMGYEVSMDKYTDIIFGSELGKILEQVSSKLGISLDVAKSIFLNLQVTPGTELNYENIYNAILGEVKLSMSNKNSKEYDQYEEHLKNKPELLELYKNIVDNDRLVLLYDKTKDLTPEDMEQVLKIIDTFNKETM